MSHTGGPLKCGTWALTREWVLAWDTTVHIHTLHVLILLPILSYLIIVISPEDNGQLICCNTSRHLYSLQSRSSLHSDAAYDVTKLRPNSSPIATRDDGGNVRLTEKGHNLLFIGCRDNRENGSFQSKKL